MALSYAHIFLSFTSRQSSLQIPGMLCNPGKHFIFFVIPTYVGRLSTCSLVASLVPAFAGMTE